MTIEKLACVSPAERRRGFLTGFGKITLSATAIALLTGNEKLALARSASAQAANNDVTILNTALALEHEGIAAYQAGAETGLLQSPVLALAVQFQGQHKKHADALEKAIKKLGGTPVTPRKDYDFPKNKLKTQTDVLAFAATMEKGAASAYLGTIPLLTDRDLARQLASILGDETMHWAILLQALGQNPVPVTFIS